MDDIVTAFCAIPLLAIMIGATVNIVKFEATVSRSKYTWDLYKHDIGVNLKHTDYYI